PLPFATHYLPSLLLVVFFFYRSAHHPYLHSFPTRRSSDLVDVVVPGRPRHQVPERAPGAVVGGAEELDLLAEVGWCRLHHPLERSEEHTSELQSRENLVCRLLLEKKKNRKDRRDAASRQ